MASHRPKYAVDMHQDRVYVGDTVALYGYLDDDGYPIGTEKDMRAWGKLRCTRVIAVDGPNIQEADGVQGWWGRGDILRVEQGPAGRICMWAHRWADRIRSHSVVGHLARRLRRWRLVDSKILTCRCGRLRYREAPLWSTNSRCPWCHTPLQPAWKWWFRPLKLFSRIFWTLLDPVPWRKRDG